MVLEWNRRRDWSKRGVALQMCLLNCDSMHSHLWEISGLWFVARIYSTSSWCVASLLKSTLFVVGQAGGLSRNCRVRLSVSRSHLALIFIFRREGERAGSLIQSQSPCQVRTVGAFPRLISLRCPLQCLRCLRGLRLEHRQQMRTCHRHILQEQPCRLRYRLLAPHFLCGVGLIRLRCSL